MATTAAPWGAILRHAYEHFNSVMGPVITIHNLLPKSLNTVVKAFRLYQFFSSSASYWTKCPWYIKINTGVNINFTWRPTVQVFTHHACIIYNLTQG